jgi:putative ABC transport system substrate-binding protein
VTGDVSSVQRGALGAVGDDPDDKGRQAGTLAARILRGEKPGDIKPEMVRKRLLHLNRTTARAIGITLPDGLVKRAAKVFD